MLKGILSDIGILSLLILVFVSTVDYLFSEGSVVYNVLMIVVCAVAMSIGTTLAENRFSKKPPEKPNNTGVHPDWMP